MEWVIVVDRGVVDFSELVVPPSPFTRHGVLKVCELGSSYPQGNLERNWLLLCDVNEAFLLLL